MTLGSTEADFSEREFPMTGKDFETIRELSYKITGIKLSDHKRNMIYGRLSRRLRRLGLNSFDEYCALLSQTNSPEEKDFVNAITTNLTAFFREIHHFEYLKSTVIPRLIKMNAASKKIRIWSAGCSSGEEPHSIAMTITSFAELSSWDVKILATDLDSNVVAKGAAGVYALDRAEKIPSSYERYFQHDKCGTKVKIKPEVQSLITFKQLNLLHEWPVKGPFDIIFCRNVVIYFDAPTQKVLFERYANILESEGNLFIGHSENLHNVSGRFASKGRTIYQKL
ncbi:MAG: chemotaxis protein methyltransferase CheR [Flavobacteriales bacterium]